VAESNFSQGHDGSIYEFDGSFTPDDFDDLLLWCTERKVSDVSFQSNLRVMAEIGSQFVYITHRALTLPEIEQIVRYIYGENGPAEIKSGFDLDPSHEVKVPGKGRKRYRVNITGGRGVGNDGIQISIRTLPEIPIPIDQLGIEQDIIDNFRPAEGMVLITGTTGSGKSTLLSSAIRMIIEQEDANEKILEFSKPIEYVYDKVIMPSSTVFQTEVGRHLRPREKEHSEENEFAYCVRNAMRRNPSIILIGESRDKATIKASIEAALSGHVLMSTMHTMGVAETLRRAVTPFPGEERRGIAVDILETIRMVVTQTLLPKAGGGKVGCREYMIFDDEVRRKLLDHDFDEWGKIIRQQLISTNHRGTTMAASAAKLREQGLITDKTFAYINNKGGS
jgi:defect-in-organelle-trafficking protein DotB